MPQRTHSIRTYSVTNQNIFPLEISKITSSRKSIDMFLCTILFFFLPRPANANAINLMENLSYC